MKISGIQADQLVQNLHAGVVVHGPDTRVLYANPAAQRLLRLSKDQLLGRDAFDPQWCFLDPQGRPMPVEDYPVNRVVASGAAVFDLEVGVLDSSSDEITWVICTAYPERGTDGAIEQIVATFVDISRQKHLIPFKDIVDLASDAILVTDASPLTGNGPRIIYVNRAFTELTGYEMPDIVGQTPRVLQGPDTDRQTTAAIRAALESGRAIRSHILNYSKAGARFWLDMNIVPLADASGEIRHFAAIERDITGAKLEEARLRTQATRDALTGLLNRSGFDEVAQNAIQLAGRTGRPLSVAMIDIDHFKVVNDTHGHEAGDEVLARIGQLMQAYFRGSDIVGRIGGEEFGVLLPEATNAGALERLDHFRERLAAAPVPIRSGAALRVTASIGVATMSPEGDSQAELMRRADRALYDAKAAGRNRVMPGET